MKANIKKIAAIAVLVLTVIAFVWYFKTHPDLLHQLNKVSVWTIIWVLLLNALMLGVLTLITEVSLRLCGKHLLWKENFLLTSYSSLVNFFGPLQSGPGVRAVYLKTKHQVRLRDYTLASLLALGLFAFFSALFLVVGMWAWWQTLGVLVFVGAFSYFVIRLFMRREKHPSESQFALRPAAVGALVLLTFMQVVITVGWYFVELRAIDPAIHVSQAMSYAGAANFALFVSITPDAVGIREGFLLFSQNIHMVPTNDIVSANIIDRAAYALFLGLLFVLVIALHAKDYLHIRQARSKADLIDA
jgi:uncharacterized membrane protein YbhN (UPF0104 family)